MLDPIHVELDTGGQHSGEPISQIARSFMGETREARLARAYLELEQLAYRLLWDLADATPHHHDVHQGWVQQALAKIDGMAR